MTKHPVMEGAIQGSKRGYRAKPFRLPKTENEFEEAFTDLFSQMNPADVAIMTAGFFAGYHCMTPMTLLIQGAKGVMDTVDQIATGAQAAGATLAESYMFITGLPMELASFFTTGQWIDPSTGTSYVPTKAQTKTQSVVNSTKWSYACLGLIEAYMITRPGALAAVLGLLETGMSVAGSSLQGAASAMAKGVPLA